MILRILLSTLLFLTVSFAYAQTNSVVPTLPPAPEVAAIARYGDIPVGEYTGTLSLSIPLYNLSYRGISVPISVSYNSQGVKVADEASEVGLGWSLNAGGIITRTIRGGDDFGGPRGCFFTQIDGFYKNMNKPNLSFGRPLSEADNWPSCWTTEYNDFLFYHPYHENWINGDNPPMECATSAGGDLSAEELCGLDSYPKGNLDLESDLYSFQFGGYSGKFFIDQFGDIHTVKTSELKITVVNGFVA